MQSHTEIDNALRELGRDDGSAAARLLPLVYDELRALATRLMARERASHTLQPTALVHEAYARVASRTGPDWAGADHFLAVAAEAMRRVLVDHARRRNTLKRGGDRCQVTLDEELAPGQRRELDLLDLDEALEALAAEDDRMARVVTLRFFGGMTCESVARVLGVSRKTVVHDWTFARAWLSRRLTGDVADD